MSHDVKEHTEEIQTPHRPDTGTMRRELVAYVAEAIGTFGLVFAGCGAIIIDSVSHGQITHVGVGLVFGIIITVRACLKRS